MSLSVLRCSLVSASVLGLETLGMAEVEVAAAAEGVLHRRIEFHLARRSHSVVAVGGGGFRMETLNPDAGDRAAAGAAQGVGVAAGGEGEARRAEKGEVVGGGLDPELSVARIYLGRIVSARSCVILLVYLRGRDFVRGFGGGAAMRGVFTTESVDLY